jgi:hypothetical protein
MLASIFITLTLSFLLLRHERTARQNRPQKSELGNDKETTNQHPPTSFLPIAASMRKRAPDSPPPLPQERQSLERPSPPEMTTAIGFNAFHIDNNDNDNNPEEVFAGELRDRLIQLERSGQKPGGPRVYIPPSPPSPVSASTGFDQQVKQVKFSTIRTVENMPVLLGSPGEDSDVDTGFTVSRTVMRSASKKEEKGGIQIGVRTWVETGRESAW